MYNRLRDNRKSDNKIKYLLRTIPLIILIGGITVYFLYGKDFTMEQIFDYSPQNKLLASLFILLLFILKSFSVVFPVAMIYIVVGLIFPPMLAVFINITGISVGLSCSYFMGYFSRKDIKEQLMAKYPKLHQIDILLKNNEWVFTYLVRTSGILPLDVVSIIMGLNGMPYRKYITASILGVLPALLTTTLIGATISNPRSPAFILSIIAKIIIFVISIFIYKKILKKKQFE